MLEDCEPRRVMRFVWMLPTSMGDAVVDRRAAAAAAEERAGEEVLVWKKAEEAARVALEAVLLSTGCMLLSVIRSSHCVSEERAYGVGRAAASPRKQARHLEGLQGNFTAERGDAISRRENPILAGA